MIDRFLVLSLLLIFCGMLSVCAFCPRMIMPTTIGRQSFQSLSMMAGGFGGEAGDSKKKKSKPTEVRLKPKAQWDRYTDLKKEPMIRVAVQVQGQDEWLEVGRVRSKENKYTDIAVARQRALIVDHARRLFPLQVSAKDKIEWAYWEGSDEDGSWKLVDKSVVESAPDGIEKQIGFEGRPDPATGFYCLYDSGRLVGDPKDKNLSTRK